MHGDNPGLAATIDLRDKPFSEQGTQQTAWSNFLLSLRRAQRASRSMSLSRIPRRLSLLNQVSACSTFAPGLTISHVLHATVRKERESDCSRCFSSINQPALVSPFLRGRHIASLKVLFEPSSGEWLDRARQQRLPGLIFGSDFAVDLITYLGVQQTASR